MPWEGTQVHENRELDWARWVRRAAAERAHLGPRSQPVFGTGCSTSKLQLVLA
jgi:hypothetical protein